MEPFEWSSYTFFYFSCSGYAAWPQAPPTEHFVDWQGSGLTFRSPSDLQQLCRRCSPETNVSSTEERCLHGALPWTTTQKGLCSMITFICTSSHSHQYFGKEKGVGFSVACRLQDHVRALKGCWNNIMNNSWDITFYCSKEYPLTSA